MTSFVSLALLAALAGGPDTVRDRAPQKLWVSFKDKALASPEKLKAELDRLQKNYDPHAIDRRRARRTRPGLFDETDVPVAEAYAAAVRGTGATVHVSSAWLNAVSVRATPEQRRRIAALPFVREVTPVAWGKRSTERPETTMSPGATDDFYGFAHDQVQQINLIAMHNQGFTGAGIRIGILDTGFKRSHIAFNHPTHPLQVIAEHDFVMGDGNTAPQPGDDPDQHSHGTMILGTLGAYAPNDLVGVAYNAAFILCKTEDITSETPVEEDNYVAGLEFIESHGGDVATASLVYADWYTYAQFNGSTAPCTIAVNLACANGVYCCNAVGNSGHDNNPAVGHIAGVPADAFQVLSIGAVQGDGNIADFSSDGPTADGRIKPEVLARGQSTSTVHPGSDTDYATASGTSLSTPLAAGAVACLAQARPWWSVAQMRTHVMNTAGDFVINGQPDPLMIRGFGIINAAAALASDCYPDCDGVGGRTGNDFQCFLNAFVAGSLYADCDQVGGLTGNDFQCFLNAFVAGCS